MNSNQTSHGRVSAVVFFMVLAFLFAPMSLRADRFAYVDKNGVEVSVDARLIGERGDAFALELADGSLRFIPTGAVKKRVAGDGPEPASPDVIIQQLKKEFGDEKLKALASRGYIIAVVLEVPLPKKSRKRLRTFQKKAARFMQNVEKSFGKFAKRIGLKLTKSRYPLVLVIFESDDEFQKFHASDTRGVGLKKVSGFYNRMSNRLAIRMSECYDFKVPLHEAIHQQTFNRGMLHRLGNYPTWFTEGIATGFEGSGLRVTADPSEISVHYARRVGRATEFNWTMAASDDRVFRGDVLAGTAYVHAWSLHWLLVTRYRKKYARYVELLAARKPWQPEVARDRAADFQKVFGKGVAELQREFPQTLRVELVRQRVSLEDKLPAGLSITNSQLGEARLTAVRINRQQEVLDLKGTLRNISTLRDLSFYVTVETSSGAYADWYFPLVRARRVVPLPRQLTSRKKRPGNVPAGRFRVNIRSAVIGSQRAKKWQQGALPQP